MEKGNLYCGDVPSKSKIKQYRAATVYSALSVTLFIPISNVVQMSMLFYIHKQMRIKNIYKKVII